MPRSNSWRGQDWSSDLPLWHVEHPLFQAVGKALLPETVRTHSGETEVAVPDIDEELRPIVAAFAVAFTARFYKAQRIMPTIALEAVALLYCNLGATDEAWREFLDKLGVKIATQSRNLFISFLRWVCGNAPDKSNRLGKMAKALAAWVAIYKPGPATLGDEESEDWGSPDPIYSDEDGPGTSDFAEWLQGGGGYSRVAAGYSDLIQEPPTPEPESEPQGEPSPDGTPEPPPAEPSPDGSPDFEGINDADDEELTEDEKRAEADCTFQLTAVYIAAAHREGRTVGLIGCTGERGQPTSQLVSPDDPRAKTWAVRLSDNDRLICDEARWHTRSDAETFIENYAQWLPQPDPPQDPAPDHALGPRPETRRSAKPPKGPLRSSQEESTRGQGKPLPNWRKDPEAYGVALLARDSHKAVQIADAILSALFAITEASDNPLETGSRMSSCPPNVAEAIEARKRVAELVTERNRLAEENAYLKAALERAKVPA